MMHSRSPITRDPHPIQLNSIPATAASSMTHPKVLFRPWWDENPYQQLLADHLTDLGAEVGSISRWSQLFHTSQQPDILHLHWLHPVFLTDSRIQSLKNLMKFTLGLLLLRLRGIKVVWTAHNLKDHDNRNPFIDCLCTALVVHLANGIIAHGETAKRDIVKRFKLGSPSKISVVPHGSYIGCYENSISPMAARQCLGLPDSSLVFVFLGAIRPYKGVLELVSAFKQLHCTNARLVIAGKPDSEAMHEEILAQVGDRPDITFRPGFVPDDQIQVYMNACDVAVFPYRDILTSGSVLLAMSFGRACIAPRQGCIHETLDSSGAFLYDPQLETGLYQALQQAIQRRADLGRMGDRNLNQAEAWHWSRIAAMTMQVYQSC